MYGDGPRACAARSLLTGAGGSKDAGAPLVSEGRMAGAAGAAMALASVVLFGVGLVSIGTAVVVSGFCCIVSTRPTVSTSTASRRLGRAGRRWPRVQRARAVG